MSELDIIRNIVQSYQTPNGPARDESIKEALSTPQVKEIAVAWLDAHQSEVDSSPILKDLKTRVIKPEEVNSPHVGSSFISTAVAYASTAYKKLSGSREASDIENGIVSGNLNISYLINNPKELIKYADLLKTHLSIGTLGYSTFLIILREAAKIMIQTDLPSFPETEVIEANQSPSLFRIFSKELKDYIASPSPIEFQDLSSLVKQDAASAEPYIDEMPKDLLLKLVTTAVGQRNTVVLQPDAINVILPTLLKKLSIDELVKIFSQRVYTLYPTPWHFIFLDSASSLSKSQWLKLSVVFANSTWGMHDSITGLKDKFPPFAQRYIKLLHGSDSDIQRIKTLHNLNQDELDAATVYFIQYKGIQLSHVQQFFSRDEIIRFGPYFDTLNLEWFDDVPLALELLKNCPNLTYLCVNNPEIINNMDELSQLESLGCSLSIYLIALPAWLSQLKWLDCHSCPHLTSLPAALPQCRWLNYSNCPGIRELPELPFDATVISDSSVPFQQLVINFEQFSTEPEALLLSLGKLLLNKQPFPNICYFEKGQKSEAIDAGGVRRDFITRLCENVFKKELEKEAFGQFLTLGTNSLPLPNEGAPGEEDAYRTLGVIFAHCYAEDSNFKTGPLFDERLYRCLAAPGDPGTGETGPSEEWLLNSYITLAHEKYSEKFKLLMGQGNEIPKLSKVELETIAFLLNEEQPPVIAQEYFQDPANRDRVRRAFLDGALEYPNLKAISWIAQGMKSKLGDSAWANLRAQSAGALKDRLEGIVNVDAVKAKLRWDPSPNFDHSKLVKTITYLNTWIEQNPERLSLFVRALTGNKTLCAQDLLIQVFNRGSTYIPIAHTCSYSLELSGEYDSQEQFNHKLDILLTEGMAGSGFSFG